MILGNWEVAWFGGLALRGPAGVVILDAPSTLQLPDAWAAALRGVVLSSGRIDALGGLLGALAGATGPVHVLHGLQDNRTPALLSLWGQAWGGAEVLADAAGPGAMLDLCGVEVTLHPLAAAERVAGHIHPTPAHGLRVHLGDHTLAYLPSARASAGAGALCADASLAIITIGVTDWPRTHTAWRARVDEAARMGARARHLWLVGDDGQRWRGDAC